MTVTERTQLRNRADELEHGNFTRKLRGAGPGHLVPVVQVAARARAVAHDVLLAHVAVRATLDDHTCSQERHRFACKRYAWTFAQPET